MLILFVEMKPYKAYVYFYAIFDDKGIFCSVTLIKEWAFLFKRHLCQCIVNKCLIRSRLGRYISKNGKKKEFYFLKLKKIHENGVLAKSEY